MSVIDAHVHLYPPEANAAPAAWAEARGEGLWSTLCTRRRKDGSAVQGFPSLDQLLGDMDAAGIDRAILLGWYWQKPATCFEQNRFYLECVRAHPDRLAAFATVHADAGEAALAEVRWAKENGFLGLGELSPHSQHVSLIEPTWRRLLALAGELGLPVNLHVTDPRAKPYPGRVETPLADFVAMAREFPATKFILAHWGGGLAFDAANRTLDNVWYDSAASSLLYGDEVWRKAPPGRVLFGTDYPLVLYPRKSVAVDFTGLLAEARGAGAELGIFGASAQRLFGC